MRWLLLYQVSAPLFPVRCFILARATLTTAAQSAFLIVLAGAIGCERSAESPEGSGAATAQRVSPIAKLKSTASMLSSFDFGVVQEGGCAEARIELPNNSDSWIEIATVKTSCPCFQLDLATRHLGPREVLHAIARLDLSTDPEFTGGLSPEARFCDHEGDELFSCVMRAKVVPSRNVRSPRESRRSSAPNAEIADIQEIPNG